MTKEDPKPDSRKGHINANILRKHGLTEARMKHNDEFWFFEMMFPVCNLVKSTVDGNGQIPYFSHVY